MQTESITTQGAVIVGSSAVLGQRTLHLSKICGEGAHEITADIELPKVILRQGNQTLTVPNEEQLGELFELIEECFAVFDDARQPKQQNAPLA